MATTVFPCPKCRAIVRLREGESHTQCTGCGATVSASASREVAPSSNARGGDGVRGVVIAVSLLSVAVGVVALKNARHPRPAHEAAPETPMPIYTAPPTTANVPTPAGELAWEPNARAPLVLPINDDAVEDIFGFFRVWDGLSAWTAYAGAFDGVTLKPLWRTEAIDPQVLKQPGVVPMALIVGPRIVVADTSATLRVFTLATGEKQATLQVAGAVAELCRAPDKPTHVWVKVIGDADAMIDLDTGKATLTPRPKGCPPSAFRANLPDALPKWRKPTPQQVADATQQAKMSAACNDTFLNYLVAQATCTLANAEAPVASGDDAGFRPRYALTNGALSIAIGTKAGKPFATSQTKGSPWEHGFITDDTKPKPVVPAVADLTPDRLYAVYDKLYFDARLAALDARTGGPLWDVPVVGSLAGSDGTGRGDARSLVATAERVYVVRAGGGLDVFEASSGKAVGTIGKQ